MTVCHFSYGCGRVVTKACYNSLFRKAGRTVAVSVLGKTVQGFTFSAPNVLGLRLSKRIVLSFLLSRFIPTILCCSSTCYASKQTPSGTSGGLLTVFSNGCGRSCRGTQANARSFSLCLQLLVIASCVDNVASSCTHALCHRLDNVRWHYPIRVPHTQFIYHL